MQRLEPVFKDGHGVKEGRVHHRGKFLPVVRWRFRLCGHGRRRLAQQKGLSPLGVYRGLAVAGCQSDEMGIGPVFAVPKLLAQRTTGCR